ncbi:MAG: DUF357 domain-containing protein [Methanomicrobium sp.]|nr:DUF357 domain-containing protein [Methanomicrobium sp.]
MKPETFGEIFEREIQISLILPKSGSPYFRLSEEILEMASAYRTDGLTFTKSGDLVNAHASFAYGFGWLDFGISSGLVKGIKPAERLPIFNENMPQNLLPHLLEKTNRYNRMLSKAVVSVAVAPDIESPLHSFSESVLKNADDYLSSGEKYLSDENYVNSLAHFSYGYGLLDAAVRCGLMIITGSRSLFTV